MTVERATLLLSRAREALLPRSVILAAAGRPNRFRGIRGSPAAEHTCVKSGGDGRPCKIPEEINLMMDRFYRLGDRAGPQAKDESGQTFVEYALVLSVIVVGVLLVATWGGLRPPSGRDRRRHHRARRVRPTAASFRRARRKLRPTHEMKTMRHHTSSGFAGTTARRSSSSPSSCRPRMLVFGIAQFGLLFRDYLAITDAARVGARAAAVQRTSSVLARPPRPRSRTPSRRVSGELQIASKITCYGRPERRRPDQDHDQVPLHDRPPVVSASGDLTASATERME